MKTQNSTAEEIKSLFRDFKIQIIQGRKFYLNEANYKEFIKSDKYNAYLKFTPGEIITGSVALKLLGLLDRESKDIDLIIPGEKSQQFGTLQTLFYSNDHLENYIGTKYVEYRRGFFSKTTTIQFDFFGKTDSEILTFNELKIENPLTIIEKKIKLADNYGFWHTEKNTMDLFNILLR